MLDEKVKEPPSEASERQGVNIDVIAQRILLVFIGTFWVYFSLQYTGGSFKTAKDAVLAFLIAVTFGLVLFVPAVTYFRHNNLAGLLSQLWRTGVPDDMKFRPAAMLSCLGCGATALIRTVGFISYELQVLAFAGFMIWGALLYSRHLSSTSQGEVTDALAPETTPPAAVSTPTTPDLAEAQAALQSKIDTLYKNMKGG